MRLSCPHKLNRNVRELVALHREQLGFLEPSKMPKRRISDLVLVDTQAIAPLRGMDPPDSRPDDRSPPPGEVL